MFATVIFGFLAVLGFTLNTVTVLTFTKNRKLLSAADIPVLSMAVADNVLATIATPLAAFASAHARWPFDYSGCSWYAYFNVTVGLGSILHHVAIAVERCSKTHFPMSAEVTRKKMSAIISLIWALASIWGIFPLIGWSAYVPEANGISCSLRWKSINTADTSFVICTFTFFLLLPSFVLIASYAIIYYDLRQMEKRSRRNCGKKSQQTLETVLAKKRLTLTTFIMVVSFLIVWSPYAALSFYRAFWKPVTLSHSVSTAPSIFAKTSLFINPVTYFIRYKRFRKGVKKLFGKIFSCGKGDSTTQQKLSAKL